MNLQNQLREDLKTSLKNRDTIRLNTVRGILTACTNELVASGKTPQDTLDDDGVLSVIKKLSKQRLDSIEQYETAGRLEQAEKERAELAILETYLPPKIDMETIRSTVKEIQAETQINDPAQKGKLIGMVMKKLGGQADGNDVKSVIDEIFNQ